MPQSTVPAIMSGRKQQEPEESEVLPIGELVGCRVRVTLQDRTIEAEVFAVDAGTHMVVLQQRLPDARKRNIFTVRDSFIKNIEVRRWAGHGAGCPTICCCSPLAAVLCCAVLPVCIGRAFRTFGCTTSQLCFLGQYLGREPRTDVRKPLPTIAFDKLVQRENAALARIGVGVSSTAQSLFDAISKT